MSLPFDKPFSLALRVRTTQNSYYNIKNKREKEKEGTH